MAMGSQFEFTGCNQHEALYRKAAAGLDVAKRI
jgi:hypothetical protein